MSRWLVVGMKDSLGLGKFGLYHDLKQSHAKLSREGTGTENHFFFFRREIIYHSEHTGYGYVCHAQMWGFGLRA